MNLGILQGFTRLAPNGLRARMFTGAALGTVDVKDVFVAPADAKPGQLYLVILTGPGGVGGGNGAGAGGGGGGAGATIIALVQLAPGEQVPIQLLGFGGGSNSKFGNYLEAANGAGGSAGGTAGSPGAGGAGGTTATVADRVLAYWILAGGNGGVGDSQAAFGGPGGASFWGGEGAPGSGKIGSSTSGSYRGACLVLWADAGNDIQTAGGFF